MQSSKYYLAHAQTAQRLADEITNTEAAASLSRMARDYRDIAEDLENGAVEIRHPERMPQRKRGGEAHGH
jgi:hypothetical protein